MINTINVFTLILLKLDCKHIKLFLNVYKNGKLVTIITILDDYCSLRLLLTLKIGRYQLLSKRISRQNQLISHPYYADAYTG